MPQYPTDVAHEYQDKYLLAEFLVDSTICALIPCLAFLGMTEEQLGMLHEWAMTRSVTLRFAVQERCTFLRKAVHEVTSDTRTVHESTILGTSTSTVVTKVAEYIWSLEVDYALIAYYGNDPDTRANLQSRVGCVECRTSSDVPPRPLKLVPIDEVNITWLLQHLGDGSSSGFAIDRTAKACRTPRRNPDVAQALDFIERLHDWCSRVHFRFTKGVLPPEARSTWDLAAVTDAGLFIPVLPILEAPSPTAAGGPGPKPAVVPVSLQASFLAEQQRSIREKFKELALTFPATEGLVTAAEARLLVILLHSRQICQRLLDGVGCIETMLRRQLAAAIGREVTPVDLAAYMRFHDSRLYPPQYQPRPFSYAVRRPQHHPEGSVSIVETPYPSGLKEPIHTTVSWTHDSRPMFFALDAATKIDVRGERFLHGWLRHTFAADPSTTGLSLVARAHHFSTFILLVGSIAAADLFQPKYGIVVQNKDLLEIPLLLETIPAPKEFKRAVSSLSPEQQHFAQAIRSMQLESTLFGVCVIQVKPQLERLLKLPPGSLTKELELTQELRDLFLEYHTPSDLLSYDGDPAANVSVKLDTVTGYARSMRAMIQRSKDEQLAAARAQQEQRLAEEAAARAAAEAAAEAAAKAERDAAAYPRPITRVDRPGPAPGPGYARVLSAPRPEGLEGAMWAKPVKQGQLLKRGEFVKNWKPRWFILQADKLFYFKNRTDDYPIDFVPLQRARVTVPTAPPRGHNWTFELDSPGMSKTILLAAPTKEERDDWVEKIKRAATENSLSVPFNVSHNVHVDFNSTTGFQGLPTEWKTMLQSSGMARHEVAENADAVLGALRVMESRQADIGGAETEGKDGGWTAVAKAAAPPASAPGSAPAPEIEVDGRRQAENAAEKLHPERRDRREERNVAETDLVDYTRIPAALEKKFDELDADGVVRPTIISVAESWTRTLRKSVLAAPSTSSLRTEEQETERSKAFDLLDSLTNSGALPIDCAALHVVIAATHCFDTTLVNTVIQDSVNPIEKIERSSLILASTIHATDALDLVSSDTEIGEAALLP